MCIRDRCYDAVVWAIKNGRVKSDLIDVETTGVTIPTLLQACLLYTSDAADDLLCVDLGGRRIIKKKKHNKKSTELHHRKQMQQSIQYKTHYIH